MITTNTTEGITEIHDWIERQIDFASNCYVCAAEGTDEDSPRAKYYDNLYANLTHAERVTRSLLTAMTAA